MRSKHGDVENIKEAGRIEAHSDKVLGWNLGSGWSKWTRCEGVCTVGERGVVSGRS